MQVRTGRHITVLLRKPKRPHNIRKNSTISKSLSGAFTMLINSVSFIPHNKKYAKALQCVCQRGSFTVEAAFVLPLFLFLAVVMLGLFPMLVLQIQVNNGLQYAARMVAVSYQDEEQTEDILSLAEGKILFRSYMKEHGCQKDFLERGSGSISLAFSDVSGDYVTMVASYAVKLPISFWNLKSLPVQQCVRMKKWTGADQNQEDCGAGYVYITPSGNAYHRTSECSYLKLSIKRVSLMEVRVLRNKDGGIYYPCSCYKEGGMVYITDYGTEYHGSLDCGGLKRTIYKVTRDQVEGRHACSKCYWEEVE